ncbi:MAG: hypothetical protein ACKPI8_03885 [Microcystis panniformis]|uniref:Genome sequencing data, contig C305 n=1 Tax=Microcystis aeruginosa PCC 9807 TaxID=1160283 RepID=I4H4V4_MICAE|nr:hypothetical protein [Microcystis aeruginosa]CCI17078.1 Genome sequencing data, contig C305 [Microcystis aeruginosa PCC 9807]
MSGRGGWRGGAGRKRAWQNGETQTIRVPIALKDQILDFSQQLDRGEAFSPRDLPLLLEEILAQWEVKCQENNSAEWQPVRQLLAEIEALLAQETECKRGHGRSKAHCGVFRHHNLDSVR